MSDSIDIREYTDAKAKAQMADRIEKENDKLLAKNEKLEEALVKAKESIAEFQLGKREYETLLAKDKAEREELAAQVEALKKEIEAAKKDKEDKEKENKEKASVIETLQKELDDLKAAQVASARQAMLVAGGLDPKEAETQVKLYASFNDDQFKAMAATVISANTTAAALKDLQTQGKVTAETLERMNINPEGSGSSDAKKEEDEKKKEEEGKGKKSKAGKIFAELGLPTPRVGQPKTTA